MEDMDKRQCMQVEYTEEMKVAIAEELIAIHTLPGNPKRALKKEFKGKMAEEVERRIVEEVDAIEWGEQCFYYVSKDSIFDEYLVRLRDGRLVVAGTIGKLPEEVPVKIVKMVKEWQKRGITATLHCTKEAYGFTTHYIEWAGDKVLNTTLNTLRQYKTGVTDIESYIYRNPNLPETLMNEYKERLEWYKEAIPAATKNYNHIVETRMKYNPAQVFTESAIGFGFLYSYHDTPKARRMKMLEGDIMDTMEDDYPPEIMTVCKEWKIFGEETEELREFVKPTYTVKTRELAMHKRDAQVREWQRVMLSEGYNPLRYNQFTSIADIEAGIVTPKGLKAVGKKRIHESKEYQKEQAEKKKRNKGIAKDAKREKKGWGI